MDEIALAVCQALLDRHHRICAPRGGEYPTVSEAVIGYQELFREAGYPGHHRQAGRYLLQIAEWCQANPGWPPLNALAINVLAGRPSEEYDGAGGFRLADWDRDVRACIRFRGYPNFAPRGE